MGVGGRLLPSLGVAGPGPGDVLVGRGGSCGRSLSQVGPDFPS